jgi:hypothetical protein
MNRNTISLNINIGISRHTVGSYCVTDLSVTKIAIVQEVIIDSITIPPLNNVMHSLLRHFFEQDVRSIIKFEKPRFDRDILNC